MTNTINLKPDKNENLLKTLQTCDKTKMVVQQYFRFGYNRKNSVFCQQRLHSYRRTEQGKRKHAYNHT